uniref:Uncharacterized protein n=1 Tax=Anopheles epiroticus TaxID=199890 RepID=A0A182PA89_9DIPT
METCVLIPQEFALAVTGVGARHSPEQTATVWSSVPIPQGRLCYPFQGTVRIDNLAIFSALAEDDRINSIELIELSKCDLIGRKASPHPIAHITTSRNLHLEQDEPARFIRARPSHFN